MYLSLIFLPIFGSIFSGFFGRKLGVSGSELITTSCVIVTLLLSIFTFFEVGFNNIPVEIELFKWIESESLCIYWAFNFDSLTVSMLIPVLLVSSLVHIYSVGYMSHDPHIQRFFSYLSLFTFMMIVLVTGNNFLVMFVGWEGVGICSYLLVNFWFTRIAANQSSISALLTNRVGDCFLTIGMFIMLLTFGNLDYATVFSLTPYTNETIITLIGACLLIGAMAKSSQIGLHVWLPMAMEGPTPVSALIHAATMVTAGVYLLIRCSPLIEYSTIILLCCLYIGAITTILSSLIGLFQQDIKKVIAYSTMSQLGMMVIAVGLSSYNLALFHLVNHAFYKALLFLAAGAVIHAVNDNQDFRKYGGLISFLPLSYSVMLIASLSLAAFPFMTGFFSKDTILESSFALFDHSGVVVYFIAVIGAMFTTLYSVKVLYLTFFARAAGSVQVYINAHEGDLFINIPLIVLAIFSIFFGWLTKDLFIGLGSGFFSDNSIFIHPINEIMINTEFAVDIIFKLLPFFLTLLLILVSLIILEFSPVSLIYFKFNNIGNYCFSLFNQRLYIESFYNKNITEAILTSGAQTTKVLDKGSIELLGPYGLELGLSSISSNLSKLDTGIVTSYALYIFVSLIFYMFLPYFMLNNIIVIIFFGLVFVHITYKLNMEPTQYTVYNNLTNKRSMFFLAGLFKFLYNKIIISLFKFLLTNVIKPLFYFLIVKIVEHTIDKVIFIAKNYIFCITIKHIFSFISLPRFEKIDWKYLGIFHVYAALRINVIILLHNINDIIFLNGENCKPFKLICISKINLTYGLEVLNFNIRAFHYYLRSMMFNWYFATGTPLFFWGLLRNLDLSYLVSNSILIAATLLLLLCLSLFFSYSLVKFFPFGTYIFSKDNSIFKYLLNAVFIVLTFSTLLLIYWVCYKVSGLVTELIKGYLLKMWPLGNQGGGFGGGGPNQGGKGGPGPEIPEHSIIVAPSAETEKQRLKKDFPKEDWEKLERKYPDYWNQRNNNMKEPHVNLYFFHYHGSWQRELQDTLQQERDTLDRNVNVLQTQPDILKGALWSQQERLNHLYNLNKKDIKDCMDMAKVFRNSPNNTDWDLVMQEQKWSQSANSNRYMSRQIDFLYKDISRAISQASGIKPRKK